MSAFYSQIWDRTFAFSFIITPTLTTLTSLTSLVVAARSASALFQSQSHRLPKHRSQVLELKVGFTVSFCCAGFSKTPSDENVTCSSLGCVRVGGGGLFCSHAGF